MGVGNSGDRRESATFCICDVFFNENERQRRRSLEGRGRLRFDLIKILLVDDNQHMRLLLSEILRAIGVKEVYEAADGAEALQKLRNQPIDIVMTDLAMQPLDGIDLVRLLRNSQDSPNPLVPVIMVTGHSTMRRVNEARDVGVNEFLSKPVTAKGVIERISRVVDHPRPFVRTAGYFGPDRRRAREDQDYAGPLRRASDKPSADID
jgi:CheY-like chemotaxis protein